MILTKSKIYESNLINSFIDFRDVNIHRELNYLIENNYKKFFAWREPCLGYYEPIYYCTIHDREDMLKYLWKRLDRCYSYYIYKITHPKIIYNLLKHDAVIFENPNIGVHVSYNPKKRYCHVKPCL